MGRGTLRGLLALSLLCCLSAQAASPVWAIRGEHNTVYLAGSVHLLQADDAKLPAAFDTAYAGSQALVMELDLGKVDPMEAASWMMEHGTLAQTTTLRKALGESRYHRLESEAARLGLPLEMAGQFEPWVMGVQLMELQYAQLGFDPQQGVEQQLLRRAQNDGKSTDGLETLSEQLGAFEKLTLEEQARFLDMVITDMHEVGSETRSVIAAWRAGDAARLATLLSDEYQSFPSLYRALVTDRNQRWVPHIEKLLREDKNYFVVVGALHLVGEGGLLELMRKDGYRPVELN